MVGRIVGDTSFRSKKDAREFRPQFLASVARVAEALARIECLAVESARMSRPMSEFMENRAVISCCRRESTFRWKVNLIGSPVVEGPIVLIMQDLSAGILQNALSGLNDFEFRPLFGSVCRNPVNLLRVEDGINAMDDPGSAGVLAL